MKTLTNVIYFGLFFETSDLPTPTLKRVVHNPHITFEFKPTTLPEEIIFEIFSVKVIGYGNDGQNEGLLIELPSDLKKYYKGQSVVHITLSTDKKGKPVDTGKIPYKLFPNSFEVEGVIDVFQAV
jgi:hypothetical protein